MTMVRMMSAVPCYWSGDDDDDGDAYNAYTRLQSGVEVLSHIL